MHNENNKTVEIVVGKLPNENLTLYATEREDYLENFRLESNGVTQYFPDWKNVSNESYWPIFFYNDINQDGKKELIIILTKGYGTGLIDQDVHVLHKTKSNAGLVYKEIIVDNPMTAILKNVRTQLKKSEATINIANEKISIKVSDLGIDPKNLFSNIVTGNLVSFDVLNNELVAIIGAQISPVGGYIGSFHVTYIFKDGMYQVKNITFVEEKI